MKTKRKPPKPTTWTIPVDCRLPDTVAEIEAGRQPRLRQGELFPVDDSLMARLRAIHSSRKDSRR